MPDTCNIIASPVGALKLIASDRGLRAVLWEHDSPTRVRIGELIARPDHPTLRLAERQLREYFAGQRSAFDLPLDFIGTTFQTKVWTALLTMPFGETRTYAQIAAQIGSPRSEEHTTELQSLMRISYAVFCLKKKNKQYKTKQQTTNQE